MRKLLLAALLAAIPSIVFPSIASAQGYIEGAVGFGLFPDIETNGYAFDTTPGRHAVCRAFRRQRRGADQFQLGIRR